MHTFELNGSVSQLGYTMKALAAGALADHRIAQHQRPVVRTEIPHNSLKCRLVCELNLNSREENPRYASRNQAFG